MLQLLFQGSPRYHQQKELLRHKAVQELEVPVLIHAELGRYLLQWLLTAPGQVLLVAASLHPHPEDPWHRAVSATADLGHRVGRPSQAVAFDMATMLRYRRVALKVVEVPESGNEPEEVAFSV